MMRTVLPLSLLTVLAACGQAAGPDGAVIDPVEDCPPMYDQGLLPEYQLTIAANEWAALDDELLHRAEREAAGLDPHPYHPASFRYVAGDQQVDVAQVAVRLKGQSSWWQAIALDADPKMQFVISFNETDPSARFLGVRKLDLDMPRTDRTFIKQRLALSALRTAGIPAQCANNARLVINGQYYGLYTNLEHFDKELLQRLFGHADGGGDLWSGGRIIENNQSTFTWDHLDALWAVTSVPELDQVADLDAAIREWAAEMMVGDDDGYANGFANFYVYDHPSRGFLWLPVDLDTAFDGDFLAADSSPVFSPSPFRWDLDWYHYLVVMHDPAGFERFVDALGSVRRRYDVNTLQAEVDAWTAQIADSAAADPHRPFTTEEHALAVSLSRRYVADRAAAIDAWLSCRRNGGPDRDGDGYDLCHDCDDHDPAVAPGAAEVCNMVDDDCDGRVDNLASEVTCE